MRRQQPGVAEGAAGLLPRWFDPAVIVLLLASITHVARRDYVPLVAFLAVAAAIVVERVGRRPMREPLALTPIRGARAVGVGLAVAAFGVVAGQGEHGGVLVRVAVCAPAVVAFGYVLRHPSRAASGAGVGRGWVPWTVVLLLLAIWELVNFLAQPDALTDNPDHPTLSVVVEPLLASWTVRAVVLALWLAGGIWLVRRAVRGGGAPDPEPAR